MKNYFEQYRNLRSLGHTTDEVHQILQENFAKSRTEEVLPQKKNQALSELLVPLVQTQLRLLSL